MIESAGLLFDLDGTLIDSTRRIERLWRTWAAERGVDFAEVEAVMHGRRAIEVIRHVAPSFDAARELALLEDVEVADMDGVVAHDNAHALLAVLPRGAWAIVTSGSLRVASSRMRYVGLPSPDVFITADDVQRGKPAPEGYLLAAARLGIPAETCLVFEDAPAGVAAGKAAGMSVIAIAGSVPRSELAQADWIAERLSDVAVRVDGQMISVTLA